MSDMFYDDESIVDLACAKGAGQKTAQTVAASFGVPFSEKKSVPMAPVCEFLGVHNDLSKAVDERRATFRVKETIFDKGEQMMKEAEDTEQITPGAAAKLRGVYGWATREMFANVAKGFTGPLLMRQYADKAPFSC